MSPYLFLFCVKGLFDSLHKASNEGAIISSQISANAPVITYPLFADDNFLFFRANNEEATAVKALLNEYERL